MLRSIRKSSSGSKSSKRSKRNNKSNSKNNNKRRTKTNHRGGAIYSFDLTNKIGGQATNIALNGTSDGDCPSSKTADLGFVNYGISKGGNRKRNKSNKKAKNLRKSKKPNNNKRFHKH